MDESTAAMINVGSALVGLVAKQTVSAVSAKIKAISHEKDLDRVRASYDELISELVNERAEAIRIAQIYKNEVDRLVISDDDITRLHETITSVVSVLGMMDVSFGQDDAAQFTALVNADTLRTMQLLGFNYKAAIGEPLTEICAARLRAWGSPKPQAKQRSQGQPSKR